MTEDHHGVHRAESLENVQHLEGHDRVGDPDDLAGRPGGIDEGADEIEDRGHSELAADWRREPHRRMKPRSEAETDTRLAYAAAHPVRPEVDDDPEGLEHVGGAGERGRRPASVLAHDGARAGDHEGAQGGDVYRAAAVPAGPAGVHDLDAHLEALAVDPVRADKARHLLDRLPLGTQARHKGPDLSRSGGALEYVVERRGGLLRCQVLTAEDLPENCRPSPDGRQRRAHRPQSHHRWWSSTPLAIRFSCT